MVQKYEFLFKKKRKIRKNKIKHIFRSIFVNTRHYFDVVSTFFKRNIMGVKLTPKQRCGINSKYYNKKKIS